jgi:propionyl-CoA carboxylase alpha chain
VTHAPDRLTAIEAQSRALDAFAIDGIRHNIPFLSALMEHPRWKSGRLSTGFIAEEFPGGFEPAEPEGEAAHLLAAVAAAIDHKLNLRKRGISGQMRAAEPVRFDTDRVVMLNGRPYPVRLEDDVFGTVVHFEGGHSHQVSSGWVPGEPVWEGGVDGREIAVQVRPILNGVALAHAGTAAQARVYTRREAELAALMPEKTGGDLGKELLCPMPGLVKSIAVVEGQEVKTGEILCIVEAMKMENVLRAERDATVKKLLAKAGDSLAVDAVIMEFA